MGMNWLITGGCGFIGTNLIKQLQLDDSNTIRVVDNLSVGTEESLGEVCNYEIKELDNLLAPEKGMVQLVVADIREQESAVQACKDIDVIVHLAANTGVPNSVEFPMNDCITNVLGTVNYLEGARLNGVKGFIFASSGAPTGDVTPPVHEEIVPHPTSPYGASKLSGEGYCSAYFKCFGIQTVALRFGNVYGPRSGHKTSVVAKFLVRALDGKDLEIYGDGSQTRDFIYIDDLIEAVIAGSSVDGIGGEVFQIATSKETTVDEMANSLAKLLEKRGYPAPAINCLEPRLGDINRNFADTSKAEKILNWKAKTDLDTGLNRTLDFFLQN